MSKPTRVQLSRKKGWRMPENTVKVDRRTRWGNPFNLKDPSHCWTAIAHGFRGDPAGRHAASVAIFAAWVSQGKAVEVGECGLSASNGEKTVTLARSPLIAAAVPPSLEEIRRELGGRNLACWCRPDQACHADVLLALANGDGQ